MALTSQQAQALIFNNPSQYTTPEALQSLAKQVTIDALDAAGQAIDYTGKVTVLCGTIGDRPRLNAKISA